MRIDGRVLNCKREIRAGRAVLFNDLFGKQIIECLAGFWFVRSENVVKGSVFTDDHNYVLDWRASGRVFCGLKRTRPRTSQSQLQRRQGDGGCAQTAD